MFDFDAFAEASGVFGNAFAGVGEFGFSDGENAEAHKLISDFGFRISDFRGVLFAEGEFDFALLGVYSADVDLEDVAGFVGEISAAVHEAAACAVEGVGAVGEEADGDEADGVHLGDFDEEAVGFGVGDDGAEGARIAGVELALEVFHLFEADAVALGVGGIALGGAEVLGNVGEFLAPAAAFSGENAVRNEVGVAADRAGEMEVVGFGKSVVSDGVGAIGGATEAFQKFDFDAVLVGASAQGGEHPLDFFALFQITDSQALHGGELAEFFESRGVRFFVDAIDARRGAIFDRVRDGFVGGEHELFDELVAFVALDAFDAVGASVSVEENFDFGEIEIERACGKAVFAKHGCELPRSADGFTDFGDEALHFLAT